MGKKKSNLSPTVLKTTAKGQQTQGQNYYKVSQHKTDLNMLNIYC